jgi:hypothetical protein
MSDWTLAMRSEARVLNNRLIMYIPRSPHVAESDAQGTHVSLHGIDPARVIEIAACLSTHFIRLVYRPRFSVHLVLLLDDKYRF